MEQLTARNKSVPFSIWLYYGAKWAAVRVGRQYGTSEGKARELIKAGVTWVDCVLERMREAA